MMRELFAALVAAMTALFNTIFDRADERDQRIAELEHKVVLQDQRIATLESVVAHGLIEVRKSEAEPEPAEESDLPPWEDVPTEPEQSAAPATEEPAPAGRFFAALTPVKVPTPAELEATDAKSKGGVNLNCCPSWEMNLNDLLVTFVEGGWEWSLTTRPSRKELKELADKDYKALKAEGKKVSNANNAWSMLIQYPDFPPRIWWEIAKSNYDKYGLVYGEWTKAGVAPAVETSKPAKISMADAMEPVKVSMADAMEITEVSAIETPKPAKISMADAMEPAKTSAEIAKPAVILDEDCSAPKANTGSRLFAKGAEVVYRESITGAKTWHCCWGTLPNGLEMTNIAQAVLVMELEHLQFPKKAAVWCDRNGPRKHDMFRGERAKKALANLHEWVRNNGSDEQKALLKGWEERRRRFLLTALRAKYTSKEARNQPMIAALLATGNRRIMTSGKTDKYSSDENVIDDLLMQVRNELLNQQ